MSSASKKPLVVLLRGVNVGGKNKMPMARFRAAASSVGCADARTYIQSGNLVCRSALAAEALASVLDDAIADHFGFSVPLVVCDAARWRRILNANPFKDESDQDAGRVQVCFAQVTAPRGAGRTLETGAKGGERVHVKAGVIWIHYPDGIARSRLTPVLLDRTVGAPVTARNWRTIIRLDAMLDELRQSAK